MFVTPNFATLDVDEAAACLGVHVDTVYKMLDSRKLIGFKAGKEWRVRDTSIRACIEALEQGEACQSTSVAKRTGQASSSPVEAELDAHLGRMTSTQPNGRTTNSRRSYGQSQDGSRGKKPLGTPYSSGSKPSNVVNLTSTQPVQSENGSAA